MALSPGGGAASLTIPASGVSQILQRLVSGLERLGVSSGRPDYERLADLKDELKIGYRSPECHHGAESPRDLAAGDISPSGGEVSSENFPTLESAYENCTETLLDGGDDENQGVIIILQTSPPKIWKFDGERQGKICIGRQGTNDIIVSTKTTSRKHAMISFDTDRGWIIKDLNSTNKTRVNGEPIQEIELQCDDLIEIGNTCFIISQLFKPD